MPKPFSLCHPNSKIRKLNDPQSLKECSTSQRSDRIHSVYCMLPSFKRFIFKEDIKWEFPSQALYSHHYGIIGTMVSQDICTKDVADCWMHDIGKGRRLFWVSVADVITKVSFITSAHLIWPLNHLNMDLCSTGQSPSMHAAWSSPGCTGRYFICQQCFFQFCPIKIVWVDEWCGETRFLYL